MSKNRMLLWAKNYVFVSINSRDLVITELPEESTFCFDQSQCSIAARRWIKYEISKKSKVHFLVLNVLSISTFILLIFNIIQTFLYTEH